MIIPVLFLSACADTVNLPAAILNYCQVASTHYPIRPSRKDTAETKRQIAQANTIHERLCNAKEIQGP
jgi:hypothetical protein